MQLLSQIEICMTNFLRGQKFEAAEVQLFTTSTEAPNPFTIHQKQKQ